MNTKIQLRRGTNNEWTTANPILSSGEAGFATDTNTLKIGDGTTHWNDLNDILTPIKLETNYAEIRANMIWSSAIKATRVEFGAVARSPYWVANNGDTDVSLAEKMPSYFTSGTYTLTDGVLTINAPVFKENAIVNISVVDDNQTGPALKVILSDGDWHGWIRSDWTSRANGPIIVTSNGFNIIGGANVLRGSSDIIVYGDVGIRANYNGGDIIWADDGTAGGTTVGGDIILGCKKPISITGNGHGLIKTTKSGNVIICENTELDVINSKIQGSGSVPYTVGATHGDIIIKDGAKVNVTCNDGLAFVSSNFQTFDEARITINTKYSNNTSHLIQYTGNNNLFYGKLNINYSTDS